MRTLLLGLLLVACAPSETLPDCTPGATVACACVGGGSGAQTCSTGRAYDTCVCPDGAAPMDATPDVLQADDMMPDQPALDAPSVETSTDASPVDAPESSADASSMMPDVNCTNPREADRDRDGQNSIACGGRDCNDDDPLINPNAAEFCNGIDENCDGNADGPTPDGGIDTASAAWCARNIGGGGSPSEFAQCVLPGGRGRVCATVATTACVLCDTTRGPCSCLPIGHPTCIRCDVRFTGCEFTAIRNGNPDGTFACPSH